MAKSKKKYQVTCQQDVNWHVEVEADSSEEAIEMVNDIISKQGLSAEGANYGPIETCYADRIGHELEEEDLIDELCPHCGEEVQLPNIFIKQVCPSCGQSIYTCSICSHFIDDFGACTDCPLDNSACPLGGDIENDCSGCVYSPDFHFVDGECVSRDNKKEDK